MVIIRSVEKGSPAEKHGIQEGDCLLCIDGHPIRDVLDYRFFLTESQITLTLSRDGKEFDISMRKGRYDDIGLAFETFLMDRKKHCANRCIFCFIDQNPCGMRETVYFKDDDTRLSFLMGNYVTLTNVSDEELQRIIQMRLCPVNISVHTTNPALRVKMLGNPNAGRIMQQLSLLAEGKISMNCQIVACRGINDGAVLEETIRNLESFFPQIESIAVVPAGLTRFREKLFPIPPYDAESARGVIEIVKEYGDRFYKTYKRRMVYAADEFYITAREAIPAASEYDGYPQLDNGVGLLRSTGDEIREELEYLSETGEILKFAGKNLHITVGTGVAAAPFMEEICQTITSYIPNVTFEVVAIENRFFGETVTVAGLLCGCDFLRVFENNKPEVLFLPAVALRSERDRFLDDLTLKDLKQRIDCPVFAIENGTPILDTVKNLITGEE